MHQLQWLESWLPPELCGGFGASPRTMPIALCRRHRESPVPFVALNCRAQPGFVHLAHLATSGALRAAARVRTTCYSDSSRQFELQGCLFLAVFWRASWPFDVTTLSPRPNILYVARCTSTTVRPRRTPRVNAAAALQASAETGLVFLALTSRTVEGWLVSGLWGCPAAGSQACLAGASTSCTFAGVSV